MTNDGSLLAHLSSRFPGKTEDLAVEALGYILSTSEAAKTGLLSVLRSGGADVELSRIDTQVSGKEGERPDLVGRDESGVERLLIEAKFWAGLTDNQPNAYLERLPANGTLLFVAPEARVETLWPELQRLAKKRGFEWTGDADSAKSADVGGRRLILTTWNVLLEAARHRASAAGDSDVVASIQQLEGLCDREDQEAFLPLRRDELGPELPRRLVNLSRAIDRVIERAKAEGLVSTKGLRARATRYGYGRWIRLGVRRDGSWKNGRFAGACLGLRYGAWAEYRETPVWLYFDEWRKTLPLAEVSKILGDDMVSETQLVPIFLPTGVEVDHVVDSVVGELRDIAQRIAGVASD